MSTFRYTISSGASPEDEMPSVKLTLLDAQGHALVLDLSPEEAIRASSELVHSARLALEAQKKKKG